MKTLIFDKRNVFFSDSHFFSVFLLVTLGLLSRLVPHPANFTALGALALTAGFFLRPTYLRYGVPFFVLFVSDLFLGFHNTMFAVYLGFFFACFLGSKLYSVAQGPVGDSSVPKFSKLSGLSGLGFGLLLMGSGVSSVVFFLITNFAVWIQGGLYPKTGSGLLLCYLAGLPFLEQQLVGDLFWTFVFSASLATVPVWNRLFVAKSS